MGSFLDSIPFVGDIISGAFNTISQSSANKANKEIAQMNNAYNEDMLQKQMDYNTEMWENQNEYNTAKNQRKRLEEAGLNPALMLNGGSAGTAQSVGGVNPPTATSYNYEANTHMGTSIGQGLEKFLQYKMAKERHDAELENVHIENQYKAAETLKRMANMDADIYDKRTKAALNQTINATTGILASTQNRLMNEQVESEKVKRELNRIEMRYKTTQNLLANEELKAFGVKFAQDISESVVRIAQAKQNIKLTERELETEIQKALTEAAKRNGINLDNKKKYTILQYEIEKAYYDVYSSLNPWTTAVDFSRTVGNKIDNLIK